MKSFLMKVRCFWNDMVKPLVAAFCPMRLVTKARITRILELSFFVLCTFAVGTFAVAASESFRAFAGVAALVLLTSFSLVFWFGGKNKKYEEAIKKAWREKVSQEVSIGALYKTLRQRHPQEVPRGIHPIGYNYGQLLRTVMQCDGELSYDWADHKDVYERGVLAGYGYIRLENWKWRVTDRGWELLDEVHPMPAGWSPEDQPHPPVVGTPSPA